MNALLQPFPELVLESIHRCLFLMPLLLSLVIWLAKKLFVLRKKIHFQFFTVFQDSAQPVHTIVTYQTKSIIYIHSGI